MRHRRFQGPPPQSDHGEQGYNVSSSNPLVNKLSRIGEAIFTPLADRFLLAGNWKDSAPGRASPPIDTVEKKDPFFGSFRVGYKY